MGKIKSGKTVFICEECGADFPRWMGRCSICGSWNSLREMKITRGYQPYREKEEKKLFSLAETTSPIKRIRSGIDEWDNLLGGGFVAGSTILLTGEPGIGKSTLVLQLAEALQQQCGDSVLYISGEESPEQILLRGKRLQVKNEKILVSEENCVERIVELSREKKPRLLLVDSIQTIFSEQVTSLPGTAPQIRESGFQLVNLARELNIPIVIIGHLTKEGLIAGPKLLEHMVDTVLFLEGDRQHNFRLLRALKNRFGPVNDLGVFEMGNQGLQPVKNPEALFLSREVDNISGSVVVASLEGNRAFLIEIQALVSTPTYGTPQRNVTGINLRRLSMLLAVLEKRLGLFVGTQDIFVNLVGGLKIDEPAIDLGIITAVASAFKNITLPDKMVLIGEVGLAGELRAVNQIERRLQAVSSLGYEQVILPRGNLSHLASTGEIKIIGLKTVAEVFQHLFNF